MRKNTLIFDWGDTIMRDLDLGGAMKDWERVEWVPGAEKMLEEVSRNFVCCIATSAKHSDTTDMIAALKRVGADQYFDHFFSSSELGCAKPDPEFFIRIAKAVNNVSGNCISIGNLYEKDIAPAKEAGLTTIWFHEKRIEGNYPQADHILAKWNELPAILNNYL
ncbi:MAG: HAD family hydrolase [Bacteroidales bacterium]|nr:HAD family hydrolase [Bacteroidales bacterium]